MTGRRDYARPLDGVEGATARVVGDELLIDAVKTVRADDPYLGGHFPDVTLYPAVFLLDGVRQVVGAELHRCPALGAHLGPGDGHGDWLELGVVRSARVLRPMLEGDRLRLGLRVSAGGPGVLRAVLDCWRAGDGAEVAKMTVELVRGGTT